MRCRRHYARSRIPKTAKIDFKAVSDEDLTPISESQLAILNAIYQLSIEGLTQPVPKGLQRPLTQPTPNIYLGSGCVSSSELSDHLQVTPQAIRKSLNQLAQSGELTADALLDGAHSICGSQVVVAETSGANPNLMRQLIDQLRKKTDSAAIFLVAAQGDAKVVLVAGLSRDLVQRGLSAGNWVKQIAPIVGGGGGGRPDMAQAGGKQPQKVPEALDSALEAARQMLAG